jgi:O-antigen ligase
VSSTILDPPAAHPAPSPSPGAGRGAAARLVAPAGLAVLTVWLAFNAGGFFADTTGLAAVAVGLSLVLWATLAPRPLQSVGPGLALLSAALTGLAVWTLLSGGWSGAPGRAVLEFNRALLYLLVAVAFGLAGPALGGTRRLLWAVAVAAVAVCACALVTRLLPEVWSVEAGIEPDRLSYPVTYWNTLGLVAALGLIACLHLTASVRERGVARVLAAAAFPLLATALLLTFSRGAIAAVAVGAVAYLVVARPRGLLGAALAVVPTTAVALAAGYGADALASADVARAEVVEQGRALASVVGSCVLVAAALRAAALPLDARLAGLHVTRSTRRRLALGAGVAVLALPAAGTVALDAPDRLERAYAGFLQGGDVASAADRRDRLTDVGNNGRLAHWRVALDAFAREPLHGTGAGTYALLWARDRPFRLSVLDGHSLYVEALAELGLVGAALVALAVLVLLVGPLLRARGPERAVGAAVFALVLTWALRAGIDWDWEMPVVTVPVLAVGAATLAAPAWAARRSLPAPRLARLVAGLGVLALLVTPWLVSTSQRQLQRAVAALAAGDCTAGVDAGLAANAALAVRAEPFIVLGYCDARLGRPELGVRAFEAAVARDPGNWEAHYGLALLRASAGMDPRPAARAALRRNPRSPFAQDAVRRFRGDDDPARWRRQARGASLPL